MQTGRNRLLSAYAFAVYAFLFLPIVILIIFSFNADKRNFNWAGFTLDWWAKAYHEPGPRDALLHSVRSPAASKTGRCPGCRGAWAVAESLHDRFDFRCDRCRLLANTAPLLG